MKTSAHGYPFCSCSGPSLEEGKLKSKRCISESTSYASLRGCSVTPLPLIYGPPPPGRGNHSLTCLKKAAVAISTFKKTHVLNLRENSFTSVQIIRFGYKKMQFSTACSDGSEVHKYLEAFSQDMMATDHFISLTNSRTSTYLQQKHNVHHSSLCRPIVGQSFQTQSNYVF